MREHKQIAGLQKHRIRTLRVLDLPVIVIGISVFATGIVVAQKLFKLEPSGGPGGDYFEHFCRPGEILVGLRGSAGVLIDSVQAVCAKAQASGITEAQPEGPVFGGSRPIDQHVQCTTRLTGISVARNRFDPYVGSIELQCKDTGTVSLHGTGQLEGEYGPDSFTGTTGLSYGRGLFRDFTCPVGSVPVGIRGRAGRFVDAFNLVCEARASSPAPDLGSYLGREFSLESFNFPGRYIRHRGALGYIEPASDDLAKQDASFKIVPGLAGKCVSLESHNFPNHFLLHQDSRLKLALATNEELFRQDATFCMVAGLADPNDISLESVTYPSYYIRHRNFELWLERNDGTDLFRKDATFAARLAVYAKHAFGKVRPQQPSTSNGSAAQSDGATRKPPFITATPELVIVSPRRDQGTTTLFWDAGPDHPYAELWVQIDGSDETFIVEQGKGSRGILVDPGKTYLFILTDAGQRLATVRVTVQK